MAKPSVTGAGAVAAKFDKAMKDAAGSAPTVIVGYTQDYAIYVHENRAAHHAVGKAGFLLDPLVRLTPQLRGQIAGDLAKGMKLETALLRAGLTLQRESMKEVPIDTGALRASAFTKLA